MGALLAYVTCGELDLWAALEAALADSTTNYPSLCMISAVPILVWSLAWACVPLFVCPHLVSQTAHLIRLSCDRALGYDLARLMRAHIVLLLP